MEGEQLLIVENSLPRSGYDFNIALYFYLTGGTPALPG
jgi:hypothetical protein